jgi:hypothetical protein
MQSFEYRSSYNIIQALTMGLGTLVAGKMWWTSGRMLILGLGIICLARMIIAVSRLTRGEPALSFNHDGVTVPTILGDKQLSWHDISSIYLQKRSSSSIAAVPLGGSFYVCFDTGSSMPWRRVWVPTSAIELPPGGAEALFQTINDAWRSAIGTAAIADHSGDALSTT